MRIYKHIIGVLVTIKIHLPTIEQYNTIQCVTDSIVTEQLALKKKEYANMAREINQIKMEIDATRDFLDDQKLDRENQGMSHLHSYV